MRQLLILFAVLGGLSCLFWTGDALSNAASPLGMVRAGVSLSFAGGALSLTLLCCFGAAVLRRLTAAEGYLRDIRDRLAASTTVTAALAVAQPQSGQPLNPAGSPMEVGPSARAGNDVKGGERREPTL